MLCGARSRSAPRMKPGMAATSVARRRTMHVQPRWRSPRTAGRGVLLVQRMQ